MSCIPRAQHRLISAYPGRSAARSECEVVRCRPGIVTGAARSGAVPAQAPDQRCTVPLRGTLHRIRGTSECLLPGRSTDSFPRFPGAAQHAANAKWCAADPGSSPAPSSQYAEPATAPEQRCTADALHRIRGTSECLFPGRGAERSECDVVRCRPGIVTDSALLARATLGKAPAQRCTVPLRCTLHRIRGTSFGDAGAHDRPSDQPGQFTCIAMAGTAPFAVRAVIEAYEIEAGQVPNVWDMLNPAGQGPLVDRTLARLAEPRT